MAIGDVTVEGVERAIAEFDELGREAFLDRHGFGAARSYFLVRDGRRYDSKAILGVAHGYSGSGLKPLRPQKFSGGDATVARHLESLGFSIERPARNERPPRNPPWSDEERILALDLYLRAGLLDDKHPEVIELSSELNALPGQPKRPDAARFRNPNGVALKLANFAAIDDEYKGKGMRRHAKGDKKVWDRYATRKRALAARVAAIRKAAAARPAQPAPPRLTRGKVEEQHAEQFQLSVAARNIEVTRREHSLVLAYRDYLGGLYLKVANAGRVGYTGGHDHRGRYAQSTRS